MVDSRFTNPYKAKNESGIVYQNYSPVTQRHNFYGMYSEKPNYSYIEEDPRLKKKGDFNNKIFSLGAYDRMREAPRLPPAIYEKLNVPLSSSIDTEWFEDEASGELYQDILNNKQNRKNSFSNFNFLPSLETVANTNSNNIILPNTNRNNIPQNILPAKPIFQTRDQATQTDDPVSADQRFLRDRVLRKLLEKQQFKTQSNLAVVIDKFKNNNERVEKKENYNKKLADNFRKNKLQRNYFTNLQDNLRDKIFKENQKKIAAEKLLNLDDKSKKRSLFDTLRYNALVNGRKQRNTDSQDIAIETNPIIDQYMNDPWFDRTPPVNESSNLQQLNLPIAIYDQEVPNITKEYNTESRRSIPFLFNREPDVTKEYNTDNRGELLTNLINRKSIREAFDKLKVNAEQERNLKREEKEKDLLSEFSFTLTPDNVKLNSDNKKVSDMQRVNPFGNPLAIIDSPRTKLNKILDKVEPIIEKFQKQQRRERGYSPSNAQLTELDFDKKLQKNWNETLAQLNEIQDEANNTFEEVKNNYEEDEVLSLQQNLENFNNHFDDIKNDGLQPLDTSIPTQFRRQLEILDKGVNRAQGAYDGNRHYSPESNNRLNDEEFYHKRVKDFASSGNAALDALQVMNNLKAFGKNAPRPEEKARFTELTAQLKDLYDKEVPKLLIPDDTTKISQWKKHLETLEHTLEKAKKAYAGDLSYSPTNTSSSKNIINDINTFNHLAYDTVEKMIGLGMYKKPYLSLTKEDKERFNNINKFRQELFSKENIENLISTKRNHQTQPIQSQQQSTVSKATVSKDHPTNDQINKLKQLIDRRYQDVKQWNQRGQDHPQQKEVLWTYNDLKNRPYNDPYWADFFKQNRGYI